MGFALVSNTPPFALAQLVSTEQWDLVTEPHQRIGSPATVIDVFNGLCESGWVVSVEGPSGLVESLDAGWLQPWPGSSC